MEHARPRPGFSLVELLAALVVLGVLAGLVAGPVRGTLDAVATAGARDAFAAVVAQARTEAVRRGGARLVVNLASGAVLVEAPALAPIGDSIAVAHTWGVTLSADGAAAASPVTVDFDAFGLGRVASRTFRFRRGSAEARLSLSTYGRARRW